MLGLFLDGRGGGRQPAIGWIAALTLLATGCGDFSFGQEDGNADGGSAGGTDTEGFGTDGDGLTGGPTGSDDGTGGAAPDCGDAFCGDNGMCIGEFGPTPHCECFDGFVFDGDTCVACTAVSGDWSLALDVVNVLGEIRIDGATANTGYSNLAYVVAVNVETDDRVLLGDTRTAGIDVPLIRGTYDIFYELENGGTQVPRNRHGYLETRNFGVSNTYEDPIYIDITPVRVEGNFYLNDASTPTPSSLSNEANVYLESPDSGDRVWLGSTRDQSFSTLVLPGTYDVVYELVAGGTAIPGNRHARIGSSFDVPPAKESGTSLSQDITIPMVDVSGAITIDGGAPSTSNADDGNLWLRGTSGDLVRLGSTRDGMFSAKVTPGDYEVIYELESGGQAVPRNRSAVVTNVNVPSGTTSSNFDVAMNTVVATGTITLNGSAPSSAFTDRGKLWLASPDGSDVAEVGRTSDGTYSARVLAGTYELRYGVEVAGPSVPRNTDAFLQSVDLGTQANNDVNIPTVTIDGGLLIGGQTPPSSIYETAKILLRSADRRDSVELGRTHEGSYTSIIIPGTYDIAFVEDGAQSQLPRNRNGAVDEDVQLNSSMTYPIDVPVVALSGSIDLAMDGMPLTPNAGETARIYLERRNENDTAFLTTTDATTFSSKVLPGIYDVRYQVESSSGIVPTNEAARLTCISVQP